MEKGPDNKQSEINNNHEKNFQEEVDRDENDNYFKIMSFHDRIKSNKKPLDRIRNDVFRTFYVLVAFYFGASYSLYPSYLQNDMIVNANVNFLICYFAVGVLAAIFGLLPGIIGSVLGDILFQSLVIGSIQWQFVFVTLLLAVGGGIFKYSREKTIPKLHIMRYLYSVLIAGLFAGLIVGMNLSEIGVSYLVSTLLSYSFASVVFIVIMDRFLKFISNGNGVVYRMALTHHMELDADHAVPIDVGGYNVFTCTRCTGTATGIISALFVERLFFDISGIQITPEIAFLFCIILPIPGLIDWGTQSARLRKSNDKMRIFTGILLGMSIEFLTKTAGLDIQVAILLLIDFSIFIFLYIVKIRRLNAEGDEIVEEMLEIDRKEQNNSKDEK